MEAAISVSIPWKQRYCDRNNTAIRIMTEVSIIVQLPLTMTQMINADGCDSKKNSSEDTYDYKHTNEILITAIMIPNKIIV